MKKNNKIIRFAIFILMITLLALVLVASTYAKYTSEAAGSDTATVAKWSFKVDGKDIAKETELTFNLFDTITNTDGSTETGIKATDGTLIAPGTMGSFKVSVENASEVLANYSVNYTIENADSVPLQFSTDKTNWSTDISTVKQDATEIAIGGTAETKTIYWKWDFEKMKVDAVDTDNDTKDTTLAIKETLPTVKVTAKITAEQKDSK